MNPDELADLEEQRTFLVRSLDDLDREVAAGDLDDLDAVTLRDDYTHRLAEVQRAIETGEADLVGQAPPRRTSRVLAIAVMVLVLAVGAGVAVGQMSGSRKPGEALTGNIRENNNDRLNRAAGFQVEGKPLEALKLYDAVIADDPENDEALAERGFLLLRLSMGGQADLADDGMRYVDRALAVAPKNPRWLFYRAVGLRLLGRDAEATAAFDLALANDPSQDLRAEIEQLRSSIGG